jgi:uncharacterized damage-inducible protein DinB/predicted RNase H-like HicB family nuclease
MKEYALYVESGPRKRKTMVHVLDLLGCVVRGATTEAALEAAPDAIHVFLRFLHAHGDKVNPVEPFTIETVEHVMEGSWIGNGDPMPGFGPDFRNLTEDELHVYLQRLGWIEDALLQMVEGLSIEQMTADPGDGSRSIFQILEHAAGAQCGYLTNQVGRVTGLPQALKTVQHGPQGLQDALESLWGIIHARLEAMTDEERERQVPHGQVTWTARRCLRRMLEHNWEHLVEISERLDKPVA